MQKLPAGLDHCGANECKNLATVLWKSSWLFAGCAYSDPGDVACSRLLQHLAQPSLLRSSASRPMRIVFSGDAGLHLCKYYFCAPSPLPPVHICKGRRGQVSSDDQQASAGRGRRLSELCSRPPSPFLGSTQAGAPGRPAGSGVAACQTCPLRQARTIALLLPAGGGGCYNIHIPPRHRHLSYCDLWQKCVNSPSPQSCSSNAPFSCTAQGFGVTQKMLRDIWCQLSKLSEQDENLLSSS